MRGRRRVGTVARLDQATEAWHKGVEISVFLTIAIEASDKMAAQESIRSSHCFLNRASDR